METINVTEAKRRLSEVLARVRAGERFLLQRRGRAAAVLINTDELARLERTARLGRRLAEALGQDDALLAEIARGDVHPAIAAFGLWRDDAALADLAEQVVTLRASQPARPILTP